MLFRKAVLVAALAAPSLALACAYFEAPDLLSDRMGSLKAPIAYRFAHEIQRMAGAITNGLPPPSDPAPFVLYSQQAFYKSKKTGRYFFGPEAVNVRKAEIEGTGLTAEQLSALQTLEQADSSAKIAQGDERVPTSARYYAAGAFEFQRDNVQAAVPFFQAVLALPEDKRAPRAAIAAFMLGRIAVQNGEADKAIASFQQTRNLVRAGAPDPDGLAVASFGEEARIHFRRAKGMLQDDALPDAAVGEFRREIALAIRLYAEQSASGSWIGPTSLRLVAQRLLADRSTVAAAIEIPEAQRLLVALFLAGFENEIPDPDTPPGQKGNRWSLHPFNPNVSATELLSMLMDAAERHGQDWLADGDQLAALAYQEAQYSAAARLSAKSSSPLASWIKAKLALQAGNVAGATELYARMAGSMLAPDGDVTLDSQMRAQALAEDGVVAVGRGDFIEALTLLDKAQGYEREANYVADRLLTIDELKSFIDQKAKAPPDQVATRSAAISDILARRLMRAGRFDEAQRYFAEKKTAGKATNYASDLTLARTGSTGIARAEAWFTAAKIARYDGMEMMGTDCAPDYSNFRCVEGSPPAEGTSLATPDERQRFAASGTVPSKRFHYRYIAVDEAIHAADVLPPRSEAYAAVLCWASHWMLSSHEPEQAWQLYQRYVRDGAHVSWASHFGQLCPAPDFANAEASGEHARWLKLHSLLHRNRLAVGAVVAALAGAVFGLWWRRKGSHA